ncbi:hypothetical protein QF036_002411 [Arthrobacter globiformis]|nr:hypothetical protein [Arthrobacter globiformis]
MAFLGTFTVAALMFLLYITALCVLLALAGTAQLLTWVFRASKPAYEAGRAERPLSRKRGDITARRELEATRSDRRFASIARHCGVGEDAHWDVVLKAPVWRRH